jgi:hypothetical protein
MEDDEREYEAEDGHRCPVCGSSAITIADHFFWCHDCPHAGELKELMEES